MSQERDDPPVRLAEIVAALSLGIDLGFGQPMEHVLRQCLISLRLADALGLDESGRATTYYTALLINVACHTDAHEQAKWFGDDIALKSTKYDHDSRSLGAMAAAFARIGAGHSPLHRFRVGLEFMLSGHREVDNMIEHHATLASELAARLELPGAIGEALAAAYERWDGRGWPGVLAGADIPVPSLIAQAAEYAEVTHRVHGVDAVVKLARERRGGHLDPAIADLLIERGGELLAGLDDAPAWDAVIDAEPALAIVLTRERLESALTAIADFVDLKSPYFLGHGRAVSELAAAAAERAGIDGAEVALIRHAGLVHGLGRLGISNAIWDKRGPLGAGERERARLQPYLTQRMLEQSQALAPIARIAVQHRERIDGSGYPGRLSGAAISNEGRILAAADAYQSMREPRPHRQALKASEAARELRDEARAGRLDDDAVEAVLGAAGHRVARRRRGPAGLTGREVEVLRLLARGLSNKEIAGELSISAKTVANHIEHIYAKIEASNRVTASLFAMQHGLLPEGELAIN